jgi:NAD(P)-dependent dehydrogenase (short-subunit alcohol dehydrogenase family)
MRSRRSGTIVNVSSVAGQDAIPTCALYVGSKFGLEGFTEALSKELEEFGISVLLVEPGAFRTNFLNATGSNEKGLGEVYENTMVDQVLKKFQAAAGKQPGDPEKAVQRIIEFVTGKGEGGFLKGQILRLVLGKDAYARITAKVEKQQRDMERSRSVTFGTDIE